MTTFATLLLLLLLMTSLLAYAAGDRFTSTPRRLLAHRPTGRTTTAAAPAVPTARPTYRRAA
ncbi:hypothetical protein [Nocardioides sp.]|uniref:hypothetical protein n=1 Tax=Nocardioides sp. TaxID=35761 RepID=UPI0027276AE6|nr:hypothetical protein [Nocardioides sp.]MDO9455703.1 hypothetical protein [Nocardioides sp.]